MIVALLVACGDPGDTDVPVGDEAPLLLGDAANYAYTLDLTIREDAIAPTAASRIDWSMLGVDLQGFPVDPARDVLQVALAWFRGLDADAVREALSTGNVVQSSIGLYAFAPPAPGQTSIGFSELDLFGTAFDPEIHFVPGEGTWLVRITTARNENAMLLFLEPGSGGADAHVDDTSAQLDFQPELEALTPVPAGTNWTVDWSGLAVDGRGNAIDPLLLQEMVLARYDGYGLPELEQRFFELEDLAAARWTATVYGEDRFDLSGLLDASGAPFAGFDGAPDATWLLALRCTLCSAPAPSFLTVLAP